MTYVTIQPQMLAAAAADAAGIGSDIEEASAAAAGRTTGVVAAAGDEVSAATATLFNECAQEFQALLGQAEAFHAQFARALGAASSAYEEAEAVNAASVAPLRPSAANVTLVMGGSGNPIPPQSYVNAVVTKYITPNFPAFTVSNAQSLFTPEAFYPLTGIKDLVPNVSVSQGVTILNNAIQQQLAAQNNVAVVGFSQSSIIASLEMQMLDPSGTPSSLPVVFSLLGDPMNPNGGLLARFPGLTMPSLGFTFYGATPGDDFVTKIPDYLDIIDSAWEGWPGIRSPEAKDYLAKHQVTAEGWYVGNPDLTVAETRRLKRIGKAVDEFLDKISD